MLLKFGKTRVTSSFEKIFLLNYWYGYENESIRCTTGLAVIELGCHEYVKIILYANNWLAHLSLISICSKRWICWWKIEWSSHFILQLSEQNTINDYAILQMHRYYHNRTLSCYEINVQKENANILFVWSTVIFKSTLMTKLFWSMM